MDEQQQSEIPSDIHVLVIDDEAPIRAMMRDVFRGLGWKVETAGNGREGLQLLLNTDFDVMVVDLRMEEMDGITFLQEALKIWPWLGVVVATGYADEEAFARAGALGVSRVLSKPLQIDELRRHVLEEALAKRERVAVPSSSTAAPIQYQLGILRQLTETAIASESLSAALRSLSTGLAKLLPCTVAGVLGIEGDDELLLLSRQAPVTQAFLDHLQEEIKSRYKVLSGQSLHPDRLRIEMTGEALSEDGPDKPGSILSVPVITGGVFHGLLTLAALRENAYETADVSFLYHAANHLSTVFAALSRMRRLAVRDALTALYNRRYLEEELERLWLLSQRHGSTLCVVIVDIDHFKQVNDTYGHPVADQALRELADVLRHVSRASDIIARYGGDEVVIVLPQTERKEARAFCERLLQEIRQHAFCAALHPVPITLSIGISDNGGPGHPRDTNELLAQADRALYAAKHAGRNCLRLWSDIVEQADHALEVAVESAPSPVEAPSEEASQQGGNILVVDDQRPVRTLVKQLLERRGYQVTVEASVPEAMATLTRQKGNFDVVLTDLSMPERDGLELLRELNKVDDSIIKVVVTGHATVDNAIACLRHGAYDFVEKPLKGEEILAVVQKALEYRRLLKENRRYRDYLEDMVEQKSAALSEALEGIKRSYNFTLEAMVAMLDAKESATGKHSMRVREGALILARTLGVEGDALEDLARGALLHDIGKIGVPDAILLKPTALNDQEWAVMKRHPEIGFNILQSSPFLQGAAEIVLSHQEHYDGTGYPRGLRGEEICLGARIFAVIDAYDAMRSDRTYRAAISEEEALAEITRCSGTHFDPRVVEAFVACRPQIEQVISRERPPAETACSPSP